MAKNKNKNIANTEGKQSSTTSLFSRAKAKLKTLSHSFSRFNSVCALQLRENIDLSAYSQKKTAIRRIILVLLKFLIVSGVTFGLLEIFLLVGIIYSNEIINLYVIVFAIIMALTLLGCTSNLTKTLYFSDDNKVLVTFPIKSIHLFLSKLCVFFAFELRKSLDIIVPITLGFFLCSTIKGVTNGVVLVWCWLPLVASLAIVVLLAAFLSVPYLFIVKFLRKYPLIELIVVLALIAGAIVLVVWLIGLIPSNIDLIGQWPRIKHNISIFVTQVITYLYPFKMIVTSMTGNVIKTSTMLQLSGQCFAIFGIVLAIAVGLFIICVLVLKPFYLSMMTKTFEYDKAIIDSEKKNKIHRRYVTFANKEFKLSFRDVEISGSYLAVYIVTPLLLYLLDSIFAAISTKLTGDLMTYAFNILLVLVPLLASNSAIATLYSKEGRAAYMKKTKPVDPLIPLISKLLFNLCFSIPSVVACGVIFGNFAHCGAGIVVELCLMFLLVQYGHIFFSATLDIMHPMNERYATGEEITNKNEITSTIVAFVIAILFSLVAYLFLTESANAHQGNFSYGFIKLTIIAAAIFGSFLLLFILKVKAYYYNR